MPYILKGHAPNSEKKPEPVATKVDRRYDIKRPHMDADILRGLPAKEIMAKYGISAGAVDARKHKLRKSMAEA